MSGEKVDDNEYLKTLEENMVNMVVDNKNKKEKRNKILIFGFIFVLLIMLIGRVIYFYYEEDIEYDSRIMECNIVDNELTFYISGQSIFNTYYTSKEIDDKTIYFFHNTINLYNKKHRDWEYIESMASLLDEGKATYGMIEKLDLKSNNIEVYYTDSSIKKIEKANEKELKKIMNESYFMCSTNKS